MTDSFKTVILVDDDLTLREMYAERFKAEGFTVDTAHDGEDALVKAGQDNPNIILLDIMMPKINGLDVLKKLKEQPETKDIPVIVLTALIQDREREEATKLGAVDYVVKSETMPGEVIEKIHHALDDTAAKPETPAAPAN